MDKSILYLQDIERCKALEPIMKEAGILPDGVIYSGELITDVKIQYAINLDGTLAEGFCAHFLVEDQDEAYKKSWVVNAESFTFRKDSIELLFPDWLKHKDRYPRLIHKIKMPETRDQILNLFDSVIEGDINAAADLAILLHQNGLINKGEE